MLDANDIQIISKIVSDALVEERKHTVEMFAQERKHTVNLLAQQKKELREELHEDMMTIIESEVEPKLRILAEGHEALLEKITPADEIEAMKSDIVILKEAAQHLSAKLNALQKAQ